MSRTETLVEAMHTAVAEPDIEEIKTTPDTTYDVLSEHRTNGERIRAEFSLLWDIYSGRGDTISIPYGGKLFIDQVIGTRYFDERAIEEVYWRTRIYTDTVKEGFTEMIIVRIATEDSEREIRVNEEGHTEVLQRLNGSDEWKTIGPEEAEDCLDEFYHRTSDAAYIHRRRSSEEKLVANNDARKLLHKRFPILALGSAYDE